MRVLHLCETVKGGVASWLDLVAAHAPEGATHRALVPASQAECLNRMQASSFPDRGRGPVSLWRLRAAAREALARDRPDVAVLHCSWTLLLLPELRRRFPDLPLVYTPHGWATERDGPVALRALYRHVEGRLPALADAVLCVSRNEADVARRHGYRGQITVIENACRRIEPAEDPDPDSADLRLLFVGRMAHQKGLDLLWTAFAAASRARPDLRLTIAGGTEGETGPLPEGARALGWCDAATLADCLARCDAVILPSRWEGLPLVLTEALSAGRPVIVSDRSGLPGLIDPGRTGVRFGSSAADLTCTLSTLDAAALRAMRPACRTAWAERFHPDRQAAELDDLLRRTAGMKFPSPPLDAPRGPAYEARTPAAMPGCRARL